MTDYILLTGAIAVCALCIWLAVTWPIILFMWVVTVGCFLWVLIERGRLKEEADAGSKTKDR